MNMSMFEIIVFGVFALMTVIGWIAGAIQKSEQKGQTHQSHAPDYIAKSPSKDLPRANELAAQRRERLAQLAAERRRSKGLSPIDKNTGPQNLSVSESTERQKAIQQYQQRAAQLKAQQQRQSTKSNPARRPTAAASSAAQRSVSRPAPKRKSATSSRPASHGGHLTQWELQTKIKQRPHQLGSVKSRHIQPKTSDISDQIVEDAIAPALLSDEKSITSSSINVRQAVIAMELLGRPVALRESTEQPGNLAL